MDWLTDAYGIKVERIEVGRPGGAPYYHVGITGKGVLHTTEGYGVDSVIQRYRDEGWAPHFTTGLGRIVQHRPLWAQASTLHTGHPPHLNNQIAQVQIEQVGFSKTTLYDLPDSTRIPSLHLLAVLADRIPLAAPFPDALTDMHGERPASNNPRRRSEKFYTGPKGWYHHMEVPFQEPSWHWDCGAIRRSKMLTDAKALIPPQGGGVFTPEQQKEIEAIAERAVLATLGVNGAGDAQVFEWVTRGVFDARRKQIRVVPDAFKVAYQYGLDAGNLVPIA